MSPQAWRPEIAPLFSIAFRIWLASQNPCSSAKPQAGLGKAAPRGATDELNKDYYFTLRNMTLQMDQIDFLELSVNYYAELMADALAVIHWRAMYDGRDIENEIVAILTLPLICDC